MRLLGCLRPCTASAPNGLQPRTSGPEPADEPWGAETAVQAHFAHKQAVNAVALAASCSSVRDSQELVRSAFGKLAGHSLPMAARRNERRRLSDGLTSSHAAPDDVLDAMCMLACSVLRVPAAGRALLTCPEVSVISSAMLLSDPAGVLSTKPPMSAAEPAHLARLVVLVRRHLRLPHRLPGAEGLLRHRGPHGELQGLAGNAGRGQGPHRHGD